MFLAVLSLAVRLVAAVVYRQTMVIRRHPLADKFRPTTFEMQLVRVGLPPLTHAVIHLYRPQWMSTVPEFIDDLSDVIASLGAECSDNIVLCGDLNCPGVDSEHLDAGLENALDALDLTQFVHAPTRGDSLLDIVASATSALVSESTSTTPTAYQITRWSRQTSLLAVQSQPSHTAGGNSATSTPRSSRRRCVSQSCSRVQRQLPTGLPNSSSE